MEEVKSTTTVVAVTTVLYCANATNLDARHDATHQWHRLLQKASLI